MARGWESKSVADQIEQADVRDTQGTAVVDVSPEMRARRDRLQSLQLSRARTLSQLERATLHPHREMLNRTLRVLEAEIETAKRSLGA